MSIGARPAGASMPDVDGGGDRGVTMIRVSAQVLPLVLLSPTRVWSNPAGSGSIEATLCE